MQLYEEIMTILNELCVAIDALNLASNSLAMETRKNALETLSDAETSVCQCLTAADETSDYYQNLITMKKELSELIDKINVQ